uniref:collagen-like triple helix repeat-containing protein n=1 Tax=Prevotella sp. TaxID=59823 RepID=UPI0040272F7F
MAKEVIGKGWITVAAINDGSPGLPGSPGSPGKPGSDGYTVCATPSVITFGIRKVSNKIFVADTSKNNTSTVKVMKGDIDVTERCRVTVASTENCTATGPSAGGSGLIKVTRMSYYTADGVAYSLTSGSVTVSIKVGEATLSHTIGVSVDMSTVWGGIETSVKGLKSEFGELQQDLQSEAPNVLTKYTSKIEQTAQTISAKVAQETVGRLNVLPGTAFNRETEVEQLNSWCPSSLEPLGGLDGTGAVVVSQSGATTQTWCGVVWRGVKLKPSTYYTASVWARADGGLDDNMYMSFAQEGDSQAFWYMPLATANETFGWKLFTTTFKTSETAAGCNNVTVDLGIRTNGVGRFCKMMLDESDTYNGWTAASYADVSSRALEATGIDIKNKTIDMTADKFTLRNNHGEKSFDVDEDGNLEARSLKSVSKDGLLTAVIKDGAFNAKNEMSGASAFIGLIDGLPYLQFTNAAGVVTYAIGATGGRAFGSVKLSLTACNMWLSVADNPVSSDSWLITYGGSITLKNLGQETLSVYKSKLITTIDGFSKKLTPTPSNDSFTMGVTGTNDKMSSVFPGAELVVNFITITETVKKKNSDGSYNTKPSGYRSVAVVYNNEKIGNGVVK